MYNAHWIHSLPYSKFLELTLIILVNTSPLRLQTMGKTFCRKVFTVGKNDAKIRSVYVGVVFIFN